MTNSGLLDAFTQLKDEGKIRFCGISTHTNMVEILEEMMMSDFWDVALVAYNFAMADDQKLIETYQKAADKGMGLVVMKTQAGASWWRAQHQRNEAVRGELNHTAMLKWALRHEIFATAVPGYTTFEHMQEDFSVAYGLDYTPEEEQFLKDKEVQYAFGFCRQCQQCVPSCPRGVDIPSLMRTAMYAYQYNNMEHAYATYQTIAQQQNLTRCRSCSSCTATCANTVPIAQKISALKALNFA
jgi:predicted aldo/keto reductase-like oxidoreductase